MEAGVEEADWGIVSEDSVASQLNDSLKVKRDKRNATEDMTLSSALMA